MGVQICIVSLMAAKLLVFTVFLFLKLVIFQGTVVLNSWNGDEESVKHHIADCCYQDSVIFHE